MQDCCTLEQRTGSSEPDPLTGHVTETWTAYWAGPCRVRMLRSTGARVAGEPVRDLQPVLQLPVTARVPSPGHRAVLRSSDPGLNGVVLYVVDAPGGTQLTMRRVECSLTRPADR